MWRSLYPTPFSTFCQPHTGNIPGTVKILTRHISGTIATAALNLQDVIGASCLYP
jgi:hypothetical protein